MHVLIGDAYYDMTQELWYESLKIMITQIALDIQELQLYTALLL